MTQIILPLTFSIFNVLKFILLSLIILPLSELGLRWLQDHHRRYRLACGHTVTPKETGLGIFGLHSTFDKSFPCSKGLIALCTLFSIGMALVMEYGVDVHVVNIVRVMNTTKGLTFSEWASMKHFQGYPVYYFEGGFELDGTAGLRANEICGGHGLTPKWANPAVSDYSIKCFLENTSHPAGQQITQGVPHIYEPEISGESGHQPINTDLNLNGTLQITQKFHTAFFGNFDDAFIAQVTLADSAVMMGACKVKWSGYCFVHNETYVGLLLVSRGPRSCSEISNSTVQHSWEGFVQVKYNWMMHVRLKQTLHDEEMGLLSVRYSPSCQGLLNQQTCGCVPRQKPRRSDLARIGSEIDDVIRNGKIYSEGLRAEGSYVESSVQRPALNLFFIIPLCLWVMCLIMLVFSGLVLRWLTKKETDGQPLQFKTNLTYLLSLLGHELVECSNNIDLVDWNVGIVAIGKEETGVAISKYPIDTTRVNARPIS